MTTILAEPRPISIETGSAPDREPLHDATQVAKRLGVSKSWVLAHASGRRRPVLKSIKLGKRVMFRPSDVDRFICECERIVEGRRH